MNRRNSCVSVVTSWQYCRMDIGIGSFREAVASRYWDSMVHSGWLYIPCVYIHRMILTGMLQTFRTQTLHSLNFFGCTKMKNVYSRQRTGRLHRGSIIDVLWNRSGADLS